ncbi:hypothetical protein PORY_002150 [Pneumocystis oryctolagi]|uniref:Uncharacterized protein n=1 Tax=Pneumocystis oryctolagi TaxID=42067 RepID=A0ACB7CAN4_9ASCO|nr:hypothetical protein PORY_002150 [Pneumocystis oryctolagi]
MQLSTMAGKPYLVGKFSYTLRVRLMREHLGINCDEMEKIEHSMDGLAKNCKWKDIETWDFNNSLIPETLNNEKNVVKEESLEINKEFIDSYDKCTLEKEPRRNFNKKEKISYQINSNILKFKEKISHILEPSKLPFGRPKVTTATTHLLFGVEVQEIVSDSDNNNNDNNDNNNNNNNNDINNCQETTIELQGVSDNVHDLDKSKTESCESLSANLYDFDKLDTNTDILSSNNSPKKKIESKTPLVNQWPKVEIDPMAFSDPLSDYFFEDIWDKVAQKNTEIYRQVFRCMPDNEVRTWKDYYRYKKYAERFMHRYELERTNAGSIHEISEILPVYSQETRLSFSDIDETDNNIKNNDIEIVDSNVDPSKGIYEMNSSFSFKNSDDIFLEPQEILEEKLSNIQGHLVIWPTEWLVEEYEHGHWLFAFDHIPPIDIYA